MAGSRQSRDEPQQKIPLSLPLAKGDFQNAPFEKGGWGIFDKGNLFIGDETDFDVVLDYLRKCLPNESFHAST